MQNIPKYADESAFPQLPHLKVSQAERDITILPAQWGLTKREYFAAMALQGIYANESFAPLHAAHCALYAVEGADALIKELSK